MYLLRSYDSVDKSKSRLRKVLDHSLHCLLHAGLSTRLPLRLIAFLLDAGDRCLLVVQFINYPVLLLVDAVAGPSKRTAATHHTSHSPCLTLSSPPSRTVLTYLPSLPYPTTYPPSQFSQYLASYFDLCRPKRTFL